MRENQMRMYKLTTIPSSGSRWRPTEWNEARENTQTIIIQQTQNRKYWFIYYLNSGKEERIVLHKL